MIERSIGFGERSHLIGSLCLPETGGVAAATGFLMFNAGVVHRIGPHRINVRLARVLAEDGIASIRFDLSGQGDSSRPETQRDARSQMISDVAAAMDALGTAAGVDRFVLFGFCSGGYQGLDAALADPRIVGLLMFDAYIYPTPRARFNRYRMRLRQHGPIRAVTGWAGRAIGRMITSNDLDAATEARKREAYMIGLPSPKEFARDVLTLLDRGVKVHMVYAGEGFEHFNYAGQFDDAFRTHGLSGRVTTKFFPDMDHVATGIAAQREFIDHLREWVLQSFPPAVANTTT